MRVREELIPMPAAASLHVRAFAAPEFGFRWHRHAEVELTWIPDGAGIRHVAASVEPWSGPEICLIGGGVPHSWSARQRPGGYRAAVVQFSAALAADLARAAPEWQAAARLIARSGAGLVLAGEAAAKIGAMLDDLVGADASAARLARCLEALDRLAAARPRSLGPAPAADADPRLTGVLDLIHRRAADGIDLATIAQAAGMHPAACCRWFRKATGMSPIAYRNRIRLDHVAAALHAGAAVQDAAATAGFAGTAHLNRLFRRHLGASPAAWRDRRG